MSEPTGNDFKLPDPGEFAKNLMRVTEQSQKLVQDFLARQTAADPKAADPLNVGKAFQEMMAKMLADPQRIVEAQVGLWQDYMRLWQHAAERATGRESEPAAKPAQGDRRFRHPDWQENQIFDFIKQSYLLTANWLQKTVGEVEGLDEATVKKVDFYTRQFIDAMAPGNFVLSNPEVLRATLEQNGENLVRGLDNMLSDLERGKGKLQIQMTDPDAFSVGENIAVSPGKVVWQTELMQLIQFTPTTEKVRKRPLLIVPPWINKYYILDLKPENSFIAWAVAQGLTVFVVSWVNPDQRLAEKSFEDYMQDGILAALEGIEAATAEKAVTAIGYCLGGTLLAATLAYMKAKGDARIKAATFFTALVDFEEAGELSVFIDEEQISQLEERMAEEGGYLEGSAMASTFNMLRANDLIWSFVINNYLLGKDPFPFDLLYWNSDSTRMPAAMHSFYLRKMYQENLLSKPGGISLCETPIDVGQIDLSVYIVSTKEDHIAPWKGTYRATSLYRGEIRFTLAGSGHIAGVVNPPAVGKYGYWTNDDLPAAADDWFEGATLNEGSWWPDWLKWVAKHSGKKVAARVPGEGNAEVIEDAPGSFVKVRSDA